MSTQMQRANDPDDSLQAKLFESLALKGDISGLSPLQKTQYMERLCSSLGLNPLTQPFLPLTLNNRQILYASRGCTDQLASNHKLTREIIRTETVGDVYVATCKVTGPDGRFDISTGAVSISNLKGDGLANALMKAETKAKRRATLCYSGLGFLDESEIETIPRGRAEYPPTKGQLIEQQTDRPDHVDGQPSDEDEWRAEIERSLRAVGNNPEVMLKKFDEQPADREAIYSAVLRKVAADVIDDKRKWPYTPDRTRAYLENFGITSIVEASHGQLKPLIDQLRSDTLL